MPSDVTGRALPAVMQRPLTSRASSWALALPRATGRARRRQPSTAAAPSRLPSCRWPGWRSTSRWRTWTGRSTTWCPPSLAERRSPASGCGSGSPAGSSTASSLERAADSRARRARWPACARWSRPSRCSTPEVAALARAVADRYAGTLADVLRLAVPPRHARVEAAAAGAGPPDPPPAAAGRRPAWAALPAAPALLDALARAARTARAVWTALPGPDLAGRAGRGWSAAAAGRPGAAPWSCVPDARDLAARRRRADDAGSAPTGTSC